MLALLFLLAPPAQARRVRVAAFNVLMGVGSGGSTGYEAVKSILQRIDADVVGFEELYATELSSWTNLAIQTGYPYTAFGANGGTLSGNLYVGFFSRYPITSRHDVTSPPGANEMTRAPLRIEVDVPDAAHPLTLWVMHHKSGSTTADPFRRAIEAYRIGQDMNAYHATYPERTELVMMGDLNDDASSSSQPTSYASLPSGLPASYSLGSDITFPVAYKVFPTDRYAPYAGGFVPLNMYQVGTSSRATFPSSGGRLDYIILSTALVASAYGSPTGEVYNSALDSESGGLVKAGSPLPSSTSGNASDHLAVFADIFMADGAVAGFVVTPSTPFSSEGFIGGPFAPTGMTYTVVNTSSVPVAWQAASHGAWLNVEPASGTVGVGGSEDVQFSLDASAAALFEGDYLTTVEFLDAANTGRVFRSASLHVTIPPVMYVLPESGLETSGEIGGPFTPTSVEYFVINSGGGSMSWQATVATNWLSVSPSSGVLGGAEFTYVTVSLNAAATNLPEGSYTSSFAFVNLSTGFGSTGWPAIVNVYTNVPVATGLADDVEAGTNGWTASGLWHIVREGLSPCAEAHSTASSWYYGLAASCTYDTGSINSGDLVSASFRVPTNAVLAYWSWEQTEDTGTSWDRRRIYITTNNGAAWTQILQSTNGLAAWYRATVNLSAYAGSQARIRFSFDTRDSSLNGYRGWYVDDVRVARDAVLLVSPAGLVEASGDEGGPFAPAQVVYAVTNAGGQDLYWEARVTNTWTAVAPTAGVLKAEAGAQLTATVNGVASALPGGLYSNLITVANTMNATNRVDLPLRLLVRDGLPDAWRLEHFGHVEPSGVDASRAGDDADADGMSNLEEYRADTQPTNAESLLRFVATLSQSYPPALAWKGGVASRQYVEAGEDTGTGRVWHVVWTNEPPTAITNLLPVPAAGGASWFRIHADRP